MERICCRRCGATTVDDVLGGELVVRCTVCDWWVELIVAVPDHAPAE